MYDLCTRNPPFYEYHALVNVRDRTYGTSLLHAAARSKDVATVRLLLQFNVSEPSFG